MLGCVNQCTSADISANLVMLCCSASVLATSGQQSQQSAAGAGSGSGSGSSAEQDAAGAGAGFGSGSAAVKYDSTDSFWQYQSNGSRRARAATFITRSAAKAGALSSCDIFARLSADVTVDVHMHCSLLVVTGTVVLVLCVESKDAKESAGTPAQAGTPLHYVLVLVLPLIYYVSVDGASLSRQDKRARLAPRFLTLLVSRCC